MKESRICCLKIAVAAGFMPYSLLPGARGIACALLQPTCCLVDCITVTECREESLELAKQLAASKSDVCKLKASAGNLSARLEAADLMRTDAELAAEQLTERLEKLLASSQEVHRQHSDLAQVWRLC
jgi:hypothetical protein